MNTFLWANRHKKNTQNTIYHKTLKALMTGFICHIRRGALITGSDKNVHLAEIVHQVIQEIIARQPQSHTLERRGMPYRPDPFKRPLLLLPPMRQSR